jgi:hypothetical protein
MIGSQRQCLVTLHGRNIIRMPVYMTRFIISRYQYYVWMLKMIHFHLNMVSITNKPLTCLNRNWLIISVIFCGLDWNIHLKGTHLICYNKACWFASHGQEHSSQIFWSEQQTHARYFIFLAYSTIILKGKNDLLIFHSQVELNWLYISKDWLLYWVLTNCWYWKILRIKYKFWWIFPWAMWFLFIIHAK